jgi:aconitate hydratase
MGATLQLIAAGARIHQTGCLGCIGMGQAPASGHNSLRTFPRNFPGRSGTPQDAVWLCSPETAAASALTGVITDPRDLAHDLDLHYPTLKLPAAASINTAMLDPPPPPKEAARVELVKGANISSLPELAPLPDRLDVPVLLVMGDDVSTDEISPAVAKALPYRSNIPQLAEFTFIRVDETYPARAHDAGPHAVVAGRNYGQGSSREHAAITPRYLGLSVVIAQSYARIHWQNLVNFGVLPLEFTDPDDLDQIRPGDVLHLTDLHATLPATRELAVESGDRTIQVRHRLSPRQVDTLIAGGRTPSLPKPRPEARGTQGPQDLWHAGTDAMLVGLHGERLESGSPPLSTTPSSPTCTPSPPASAATSTPSAPS